MCVLIFSSTFVSDISHSEKGPATNSKGQGKYRRNACMCQHTIPQFSGRRHNANTVIVKRPFHRTKLFSTATSHLVFISRITLKSDVITMIQTVFRYQYSAAVYNGDKRTIAVSFTLYSVNNLFCSHIIFNLWNKCSLPKFFVYNFC